jgi:expansin (peptidoglycan-binding protein)
MKSTIVSLLPLAGLALAQDCKPRIVTKTETESVYVTVQANEVASTTTIDVTTTSTIDITTTVTIRPTLQPSVSNMHWSGYQNSTNAYPTGGSNPNPNPILSTGVPLSTPEAATETASASPSLDYGNGYNAIPTSESSRLVSRASNSGEATFYGGNVAGGMCSFTGYTIPSSLFGTALSDSNWSGGASCGVCVSVTGPTGTKIKAMVVDQCPGCGPNHLDLFPEAFAKLASPSAGVIPVSWTEVPCGITTPIVLKNKSGTSPYWFSMQVMNANVRIAKLEVSTDGGKTWKATARKDYNFFENPAGFGTQTVDVRVTSAGGQAIVVKGVDVTPNSLKTAGSNFS